MHELLIASNPSKRKRKMSRKQRAAAMRNLAKARAARGPRRRNPSPVTLAALNPSRRKRRAKGGVRYVKRRRNPSLLRSPGSLIRGQLMPALIGGGGAVANDLLYNLALSALPATTPGVDLFRTGYGRHVGKAASALLLAWAARFVVGAKTADTMGAGALTVVGYNVVRELVGQFAPSLNMGKYLDPAAGGGMGWVPGAGWNPMYGSDWRTRSGMFGVPASGRVGAYLRPVTGGGPGGVEVPAQWGGGGSRPFAMRSTPVYADEYETGT